MPSTSERLAPSPAAFDRDRALVAFTGSVIDAARQTWRERPVSEPDIAFDPLVLYTEPHYALAAALQSVLTGDESLLDVAEQRLRLWDSARLPVTFFHAMATCLTAVALRRAGRSHAGLAAAVDALLARAPEHRHVAWTLWCGNNAYLQQVALDTVLVPVATGRPVTDAGVSVLLGEFDRFESPEGFFHDLPRSGDEQERLFPPTYIMKMLFLLGVCDELHPHEGLRAKFRRGMMAVRPLVTGDGVFSYMGRTDNSPFGAGLAVFNLRRAAHVCPEQRALFQDAAARAERFYTTFPRTSTGVLQSNRFADAASATEQGYSRDRYAYVGQYSLASCAYSLLGCAWYPSDPAADASGLDGSARGAAEHVVMSKDLGVVKLTGPRHEVVLRTGSQVTSWDRRYLGPTVLRFRIGERLVVGAISRTVSTDRAVREQGTRSRLPGSVRHLANLFRNGIEQLDGTAVGFLPVVRHGSVDYLPGTLLASEVHMDRATFRYGMQAVSVRGFHPCLTELRELAHRNLRLLRPLFYSRPRIRPAPGIECHRTVSIAEGRCRITDALTGDVTGRTICLSTRRLPGGHVRVSGLDFVRSVTGWGSDGRQVLDLYEAVAGGPELRYECEISLE